MVNPDPQAQDNPNLTLSRTENCSLDDTPQFFTTGYIVEGDRGTGDWEKRGQEVCGRWEKRGREAGFTRWREAGEKGKNYATLRSIFQSKKYKEVEANKYRTGTGIKGYRKWEV